MFKYFVPIFLFTIMQSLVFGQTPLVSTRVNEALKAQLNQDGKWVQLLFSDGTTQSTASLGGNVVGTSSSTDGEMPLFSGTGGKTLKRSNTFSGILKATSGVIGTVTAGTDYVAPNAGITGATNTKITYDSKGLVTSGTAATTADIADSTNKRYVSDANLTTIGNTSGTNTGDQTNISGTAANVTGIVAVANGGSGTNTATGTGAISLRDSPVFTTQISTPSIVSNGALGITPASGSNLNINLSGTGDLAVNTNQLYVDTSNGNVGIGTTTPNIRLNVYDTTAQAQAVFSGYSVPQSRTNADSGTILIGGSSAYSGLISYSGTANTDFTFDNSYDAANAVMQFRMRTSGTPVTAMTILGSGNIGIGTSTPSYKLDVNGGMQCGKIHYGTIGNSSASPGNATLNTVSGLSAIAAGATTMTLTNSNIASTSMIFISPLDIDATALSFKHSVSEGVGTITVNAATTATWKFAWKVIN